MANYPAVGNSLWGVVEGAAVERNVPCVLAHLNGAILHRASARIRDRSHWHTPMKVTEAPTEPVMSLKGG